MNLEDLYRLLRASHVQAQGIVDTLEEPLLVLDQGCSVVSGNNAFFETFRVSRDETLGRSLFDLGGGQWDIEPLRELFAKVVPKSLAVVGYEVAGDFPAIGPRTILVSARKMIASDSNGASMLVVFEDVTERRRAEAEKDILLGETRHRMKNLLAAVRAIANSTVTEGRTATEYRDTFLGRFQALMDAQDLSLSGRSEIDFAELVRDTAALAGSERAFSAQGPSVFVSSSQVVPLKLTLHELVVNALKYGALSTGTGSVVLTWTVEPSPSGRQLLVIDWREANGPAVAAPTRVGFGSRLIEFSVTQDLEGKAELLFPVEGFRCSISVPIG